MCCFSVVVIDGTLAKSGRFALPWLLHTCNNLLIFYNIQRSRECRTSIYPVSSRRLCIYPCARFPPFSRGFSAGSTFSAFLACKGCGTYSFVLLVGWRVGLFAHNLSRFRLEYIRFSVSSVISQSSALLWNVISVVCLRK